MAARARKANGGLELSGKMAAVVGGTQGIGLAIALRLASAGCRLIIVGRSFPPSARERITTAYSDAGHDAAVHFISADLSLVSGIKAAIIALRALAPIDYLFQTQGTFPSLTYSPTTEGHEPRFILLASRALIAEGLADAGLRAGVIVHAPGGSATSFDPDNLELGAEFQNGKISMGAIFERDRGMLDAFTLEFNARHPTVAMYHLNPGLVSTRVVHNSNLSQPWKWLLGTLGACFGSSAESVAELPVFLATALPPVRLLDNKLGEVSPTPWTLEPSLRARVWDNLLKLGSEEEAVV